MFSVNVFKMGVSDFQGVVDVKHKTICLFFNNIAPPPYFKQGLALQIWKNKINNLPYSKP